MSSMPLASAPPPPPPPPPPSPGPPARASAVQAHHSSRSSGATRLSRQQSPAIVAKRSRFASLTSEELQRESKLRGGHETHTMTEDSVSMLTESWKNPRFWGRLMNSVEAFMAVVVFANTILLGVEVELRARHPGENTPWSMEIMHVVFALIFVVELMLRACVEGASFCRGSGKYWNAFDTLLVMVSFIDIAALIVAVEERSSGQTNGMMDSFINSPSFRIMSVARIGRMMRINRLLRFIMPLRLLISSIMSTLSHLFWAVVLLFLIIYVYAVYIMQAVTDHAATQGPGEEVLAVASLQQEAMQSHWRDVPHAMLALFQSITGGISWFEVIDPLKAVRADLIIVFTTFIAFSLFAVLNVMTGVFCHEAIHNAQRQSDLKFSNIMKDNSDSISAISQLFQSLDRTKAGQVSFRQLARLDRNQALAPLLASLELDTNDLWLLFNILDEDGSDSIDQEEFIRGCLRLKGSARAFDMAALRFEQKKLSGKLCEFMVYVEGCLESSGFGATANRSKSLESMSFLSSIEAASQA